MKRSVTEWALILSAGTFLSLSTLWAATVATGVSTGRLTYLSLRNPLDDLHLWVAAGSILVCDQVDDDARGDVRPMAVDLRTPRAPKVWRTGQVTVPGFAFRHGQFAPGGYVVWSLKMSLLVPIGLSLLGAAILRRRLKRLSGRPESRTGEECDPGRPLPPGAA